MSPDPNLYDREFFSLRRSALLSVLFVVCFGVYVLLACMLPHDRYLRYQQLAGTDLFRSRWVYERIHLDPTPIDVAIIGSSRMEASVSAPMLEEFLSTRAGHPVHVANLAIPQEGRNLHYLVAKELLQAHPETRVLLVSVVEQAELSHPAFRYLADAHDVVHAPLLINHFYFLDLAFLPYRQMSNFFQSLFPKWFGVSHALRSDYFGTAFDTTKSFSLPSGKLVDRNHVQNPSKLEADSQHLIAVYGGAWHEPSAWHRINNPLEASYTQRLAEEAQAHCASVVFLRLPFYNSPDHFYDEAFYRKTGSLLDAQELAGTASDYGDVGHFNRSGMEHAMAYLEKQPVLQDEDLLSPKACVTK